MKMTSGLNEGDKVVYYRTIATTATTSGNNRIGGGGLDGRGGVIFRGG